MSAKQPTGTPGVQGPVDVSWSPEEPGQQQWRQQNGRRRGADEEDGEVGDQHAPQPPHFESGFRHGMVGGRDWVGHALSHLRLGVLPVDVIQPESFMPT